MIADICLLSAGFAAGWFVHRYREKLRRFTGKVSKAVDDEFGK